MDLATVAAELYDSTPEEFVALRKARAAESRAAGDRELAKQITALRRPTRSAWVVNLIAIHATDDLTGLLDLGAAIAEAQQRLSGADLRRLSSQRHAAIAALVHRGCQLAEVRGHCASEATRREVSDTLQAALSDPGIADEVRHGQLTQSRSYGGFGPVPTGSPPVDPPAAPAAPSTTGDTDEDRAEDTAEKERAAEHERLVAELDLAQQSLDRLGSQLDSAEALAARAAEAAELKTGRVQDLTEQLERAEREAARAEDDRRRLAANRDRVRQQRDEAEAALSQALTRLAGDD